MKTLAAILLCSAFIAGCATSESKSWYAQSLALEDINSLRLIFWSYALDGGTTTLYAVTDKGHRCIIRLNQHAIFDDYSPSENDAPGRLLFNDSLIDVRSDSEGKLIDLLKGATLKLISGDDLRGLSDNATTIVPVLDGMTIADEKNTLKMCRDEIVEFVLSDAYIKIAQHGLPKLDNGG